MIRIATKDDLGAILDIYNEAIIHTTAVYTYEKTNIEERQLWFKQKVDQEIPVIVFEIDGKVAGFATYGPFRNWPAYQYTIEHSIYVDSSYHRKGIASQLLDELISIASSKGYKTMVAGIDASNKGSITLHLNKGFTHSGTLKNVGYKFDTWLDLDFYQLILK